LAGGLAAALLGAAPTAFLLGPARGPCADALAEAEPPQAGWLARVGTSARAARALGAADARERVEALRRATLAACLAAVKDDTEAVELCARLTRKLSLAEAALQ